MDNNTKQVLSKVSMKINLLLFINIYFRGKYNFINFTLHSVIITAIITFTLLFLVKSYYFWIGANYLPLNC
jgi:hypothetical protein